MAVYVDWVFDTVPNKNWKYKKACHLLADRTGELIVFAVKELGLKASYMQNRDSGSMLKRHFDLTESKRKLAIKKGAIQMTRKIMHDFIQRHSFVEEEDK